MLNRLLLAVRVLLTPAPTWRWAIVNLMGRRVLRGLVRGADRPVIHVRELRADGTWRDHVHTRAALWGVEYCEEQLVREAIVEAAITQYGHCKAFAPAPVLPDRCAACGNTVAMHEALAKAESDTQEAARGDVADALGVALGSDWVEVSMWAPGPRPVVLAARIEEANGLRALTVEEWDRAVLAGIPMGPFPTLPTAEESAPDSDPPWVAS